MNTNMEMNPKAAAARNLLSQLDRKNAFQFSALSAIRDELISSKTATTIANMKTGIFQSILRLILEMILRANKTNTAITMIHDVMVTKRKKLIRPQVPLYGKSAPKENAIISVKNSTIFSIPGIDIMYTMETPMSPPDPPLPDFSAGAGSD